jgi:hypothetical protein
MITLNYDYELCTESIAWNVQHISVPGETKISSVTQFYLIKLDVLNRISKNVASICKQRLQVYTNSAKKFLRKISTKR